MKSGTGGFGSELPGQFGRLLMRDQLNSALYGPLQHLYEEGKKTGTDVWIHKNRHVAVHRSDNKNMLAETEWSPG